LDTGCEFSVVGSTLLGDWKVEQTEFKMYAANGTAIPLIGQSVVKLQVGTQEMEVLVLVTDVMNEFILGSDWLVANKCCWNFGASQLLVNGRILPLFKKPAVHKCSRIYVGETVTVHALEHSAVPARVVGATWRAGLSALVTEPRMVQEGVLSGRALLPGGTSEVVVPVINLTNRDCIMKAGELITTAMEVTSKKPVVGENSLQTRVVEINKKPDTLNSIHVQSIINSLPESLSTEQRHRAEEFVLKNADVFSASEFDLGRVDLIKHEIDTGDHRPFKQQLRRHPSFIWKLSTSTSIRW
jgi:hypothetical protein